MPTEKGALTYQVRNGLEDALNTAKRNVEHLTKEIEKAEREIEQKRSQIAAWLAECAENEAAVAQAEAMLDAD
jgi:prefoldin subunit 5